MDIISFPFWVFAAVFTLLYFLIPKKGQWIVVLCGNVLFYAWAGAAGLMIVLFTSLIAYLAALGLEHTSEAGSKAAPLIGDREARTEIRQSILSAKKMICAIAVIIVCGVWAVLKYTGFLTENLNGLLGLVNEAWKIPAASWIMPLGISFYTFHIIGYVVDIYRGKYPAERNFAKFFTFVTFFPHMIQGPFTRFNELGKSILEPHRFSYDRLSEGCARILWGLVKKRVIADNLGIIVTQVFGSYADYSGIHILFAMFGYCLQLYADFSGYMDIVCGLSRIWGISLPENFRQPYFARSVEEFWRRWHITLGQWVKDYVFYPVSMGKAAQKMGRNARKKWGARTGKLVPGYFALVFVWTATGLWHGANWTFLIWGYLNLFVIMASMQLGTFYERAKKKCHIQDDGRAWRLFSIIRTFMLVCFFRFFSSQPSVSVSLSILQHTFTHLNFQGMGDPEILFAGMAPLKAAAVGAVLLALLAVSILHEKGTWDSVRRKCPLIVRGIIYGILIILIILLGSGSTDLTGGFMYANF